VTTRYEYDAKSQVLSILAKNADGVIVDGWTYQYDEVGNRLDKTDKTDDGIETYRYDELDRLTYAGYPWGEREEFEYDDVGNRDVLRLLSNDVLLKTTTYTYDAAARPQQELLDYPAGDPDTVTYRFDDRGNQENRTHGNNTTVYSWDAMNRLVALSDSATGDSSYRYDPLGNRTQLMQPDQDLRFLNDGSARIADYDDDAVLLTTYTTASYVDDTLAQHTPSLEESHYFLHDAMYTLTTTTSASAAVSSRQRFYAFGAAHTPLNASPAVGFTGRLHDSDTLLNYRARYYDASLGRFLSQDPIRFFYSSPQSLNGYSYVDNHPTIDLDPLGLSAQLFPILVAVAVAALVILVLYDLYHSGAFAPREDRVVEDMERTLDEIGHEELYRLADPGTLPFGYAFAEVWPGEPPHCHDTVFFHKFLAKCDSVISRSPLAKNAQAHCFTELVKCRLICNAEHLDPDNWKPYDYHARCTDVFEL